jgi:membrane protease YdiL (CAAX protease family)
MMSFSLSQWLVLALIIAMVLYSIWDADKNKKAVLNGTKTKLKIYQETVLFLWAPTCVLLACIPFGSIDANDIGLRWEFSLANWSGSLLLLMIAVAMIVHIARVKNTPLKRDLLAQQMQVHKWMMPTNPKEFRWFTLGVSMAAGICEELLFRGFLLSLFGEGATLVLGVAISSLLFGLCHVYQGWSNVIRTGILGLVLSLVYLASDSIIIAMVLHALMDIYGGILGYLAYKEMPARTDNTRQKQ